jgi:DNA repair protein RadC
MSQASSSIKHWPVSERPRERLLSQGAQVLTDSELVAVLLRTGGRGKSALELARQVAASASGSGGWENLCLAQLKSLAGLGGAKAASVLAALELGRRAWTLKPRGERLSTSLQSWDLVRSELEGRNEERFYVLAVDARHRLIGSRVVSVGSLTQSMAHPREVFRPALELAAAALIVAHNHPSGDPTPSAQDHQVTRQLLQAGQILGVAVLDHLIVGKGSYFSYADAAWRADGRPLNQDLS